VGYEPTPEQEAIHFAKGWNNEPLRFKLVAGGERAGKSFLSAMELLSYVFWGDLFWIVGPDYEQSRHEFRYLMEYLGRLGAIADLHTPNQGPWTMTLKGGIEIATKTGLDPSKIAGRPPDGILMVEAGQQSFETYLRCTARVAEKRGFLLISGTFENSTGWYPETWKAWQSPNPEGGRSFSLPSWTNKKLYPLGRNDPEILRLERTLGPEKFAERCGGVPTPPSGLVHKSFRHALHVRPIVHVPREQLEQPQDIPTILLPNDLDDELWIDPGYAGGYAVLFVTRYQDMVYVYDEIHLTGYTTEEIIDLARKHPRFPHVKSLVLDIAAKQHQAMKSPAEMWREKTGLPTYFRQVSITDGILRVESFLRPNPLTGQPSLFFDPKCKKTIWELSEGYRYPTRDDGVVLSEKPIDRNNHACKALAYGLCVHYGLIARESKKRSMKRHQASWEKRGRGKVA
jgi:hypothetical protein